MPRVIITKKSIRARAGEIAAARFGILRGFECSCLPILPDRAQRELENEAYTSGCGPRH